MIFQIALTRRARRSLETVPKQVAAKFFYWWRQIEEYGLEEVSKIPGYHDEPLQGKLRHRVRSVRLALGYRAYYRIVGQSVRCVSVEEVNKHDYKKIERLFGL